MSYRKNPDWKEKSPGGGQVVTRTQLSPYFLLSSIPRDHILCPQWLSDFEMNDSPCLEVKAAPYLEFQYPFFDFIFSQLAELILDLLGKPQSISPSLP
jgi:hypothetical protein